MVQRKPRGNHAVVSKDSVVANVTCTGGLMTSNDYNTVAVFAENL